MKMCIKFLYIISIICVLIILSSCSLEEDVIYREEREAVVSLIQQGELDVQKNGIITLPQHLKYLSDSGELCMVHFKDKTALYFWTFRGILDSSNGYLFVTDQLYYGDYIDLTKYTGTDNFVNIVDLGNGWYSCSTD